MQCLEPEVAGGYLNIELPGPGVVVPSLHAPLHGDWYVLRAHVRLGAVLQVRRKVGLKRVTRIYLDHA
jgi:hypothetical protein